MMRDDLNVLGAFLAVADERSSGYFLYYPSRRQQPTVLSALIEALRSSVTARVSDVR
jgi:hypothetical protein